MTEIITTSDIQNLIIGLIYYHTKPHTLLSDEKYNRLSDILIAMNRLCTEENNYSLEMVVREKKA